jgi:hypothetical protein
MEFRGKSCTRDSHNVSVDIFYIGEISHGDLPAGRLCTSQPNFGECACRPKAVRRDEKSDKIGSRVCHPSEANCALSTRLHHSLVAEHPPCIRFVQAIPLGVMPVICMHPLWRSWLPSAWVVRAPGIVCRTFSSPSHPTERRQHAVSRPRRRLCQLEASMRL